MLINDILGEPVVLKCGCGSRRAGYLGAYGHRVAIYILKGESEMKIIGNKICITYGQTSSDETCPYYITLKEPMTVGEFIDLWLSNCPGEWGYFGIWKKDSIFGSPKCEYSHGVIKDDPIPDKFLNKKIKKTYGSGGWSRSDFEFVI